MASNPAGAVAGTAAPAPPREKDPMDSFAGSIRYSSTGDRAGLRRLGLARSSRVDGIVAGLLAGAGLSSERNFDRWRLVAHFAAMLAGTGSADSAVHPHAGKRRLGSALRDADYSENRLLRLLSARGEALDDQVLRAARVLSGGEAKPVNLWTVYDLIGRDPARAEAARIDIARSYYAAAARPEGKTS